MIGTGHTVTWYRRDGIGTVLHGVSWQEAQRRTAADQRGRNGSLRSIGTDQGERLRRRIALVVPAQALPPGYPPPQVPGGIAIGEHILLGEGEPLLERASQLEHCGSAHLTVCEVADRRYGLHSDHIHILGY